MRMVTTTTTTTITAAATAIDIADENENNHDRRHAKQGHCCRGGKQNTPSVSSFSSPDAYVFFISMPVSVLFTFSFPVPLTDQACGTTLHAVRQSQGGQHGGFMASALETIVSRLTKPKRHVSAGAKAKICLHVTYMQIVSTRKLGRNVRLLYVLRPLRRTSSVLSALYYSCFFHHIRSQLLCFTVHEETINNG